MTAKSKESVGLMYDRESLEHLKEKLPTILLEYDQVLGNIGDLSKDALINSVLECAIRIPNEYQRSICFRRYIKRGIKSR